MAKEATTAIIQVDQRSRKFVAITFRRRPRKRRRPLAFELVFGCIVLVEPKNGIMENG